MATEPVKPLRISKPPPVTSPSKLPRPLGEVGMNEKRRNSPSYQQATRKMIVSRDSSPFDPQPFRSPRAVFEKDMSPARFDSENSPERDNSPASQRRHEIENLKKASRVANSPMFAREVLEKHIPSTSPILERQANANKLGSPLQHHAFAKFDLARKENNPFASQDRPVHRRAESQTDANEPSILTSPADTPSSTPPPLKDVPSPTKSSLRPGHSPLAFDPDSGTWSGDEAETRGSTPRPTLRPAKSVTFETSPEINEYEQQTPIPSSEASGSRESSYDSDACEDNSFDRPASPADDDSFDASLEDTDKTPVVLPGDWRNVSPTTARTALVDDYDDVFDERVASSPVLSANPTKARTLAPDQSTSAETKEEIRPLPPVPGFQLRGHAESQSASATAERESSFKRSLPLQPGTASFLDGTISLEDQVSRLNLDMQSEYPSATLGKPDDDDQDEEDEVADLPDFDAVPRISRESIMRKVKSDKYDDTEGDDFEDESVYSNLARDYAELANLDPDVAIPSRENSGHFDEAAAAVIIKQEEMESYLELDSIPPIHAESEERRSSVIHHNIYRGSQETDGSNYSFSMTHGDEQEGAQEINGLGIMGDDAFSTPPQEPLKQDQSKHMSLPLLSNFDTDDFGFGLQSFMSTSTGNLTSTSPQHAQHEGAIVLEEAEKQESHSPTSPHQDRAVSGGSLVYPTSSQLDAAESFSPAMPHVFEKLTIIPERRATIKTGGKLKARPSNTPADLHSMIVARRIASGEHPPPSPLSREYTADASDESGSESAYDEYHDEDEDQDEDEPGVAASDGKHDSVMAQVTERRVSSKPKLDLHLPLTRSETSGELGLAEEIERVMESQKVAFPLPNQAQRQQKQKNISYLSLFPSSSSESAVMAGNMDVTRFTSQKSVSTNGYIRTQKGYLMRQNTKVVVASNRQFSNETVPVISPSIESTAAFGAAKVPRSAPGSPRKTSNGEKFIQTEPWNGRVRRKSQRRSSGHRRSHITTGPAPPLPGQESALGTLDEYTALDDASEEIERGRLFVKVVGVKDLDLPMPRNDRINFQLTLDNGLHCVTTADLELGRSASIGQEFELVVLQDLEFQLTLTTKLPPALKVSLSQLAPPSPVKPKSPTKSVFSRLLSSPKKRAERELREREQADRVERERQEEWQRRQALIKPEPWEKMRELVDSKSGSFARSYISLKQHEEQCFGRQLIVDVPCYNEWALEKDANVVSSVRSKRTNGNLSHRGDGLVRKPPYTIGKLQLQLLYVPKPKDAGEDDMPKSMSSAIRELKAAGQVRESKWEGCLSQQGGDCPYWRRRFFRLSGAKLTAYHEHTHQPRATINLSKASKLIDDKSSLVADPTLAAPTSDKRRKSAFAEEDDGYQFVEEGFRIRFANGETIDFYADNRAQKEEWMEALSPCIGKTAPASKSAKWTDAVLAREKSEMSLASAPTPVLSQTTTADDTASQTSSEPSRNPSIRVQAPSRASSRASGYRTAPSSPFKRPESWATPVSRLPETEEADGRLRDGTPPMSPRAKHRTRDAVRSMIY